MVRSTKWLKSIRRCIRRRGPIRNMQGVLVGGHRGNRAATITNKLGEMDQSGISKLCSRWVGRTRVITSLILRSNQIHGTHRRYARALSPQLVAHLMLHGPQSKTPDHARKNATIKRDTVIDPSILRTLPQKREVNQKRAPRVSRGT